MIEVFFLADFVDTDGDGRVSLTEMAEQRTASRGAPSRPAPVSRPAENAAPVRAGRQTLDQIVADREARRGQRGMPVRYPERDLMADLAEQGDWWGEGIRRARQEFFPRLGTGELSRDRSNPDDLLARWAADEAEAR